MSERPQGLVCFAIERLAERSGGAERILIERANAVAAEGFPVHIVSYEKRGKKPFYPLGFGVTHINLRRPTRIRGLARRVVDSLRDVLEGAPISVWPFGRLRWLSRHGGFERALSRYVDAHQPDVLVAFLTPAIVAAGRIKTSHAPRRIASLHNVPALDLASASRWDPNPVDVARRMPALSAFDAITVLLPEFRDWFKPDLRDRVWITPNPVPERAPPLARPGPPGEQRNVALAVGRLAEPKDYPTLLRAWATLAPTRPDWVLHILGVGPLEESLGAQIATLGLTDSVRLLGHRKDVASHYRNAQLLVHAAQYEGWGLAVTEALSFGLPAVGFADCPGVNQLIADGETGCLAHPAEDRAVALAGALARLMDDPKARERFGAAGPASMARYRPEKIDAIWRALLASRSPSAPAQDNGCVKPEQG